MKKITQYYIFLKNIFVVKIPSAESFGEGLYMFDIGQNDLADAFYSKSLDHILASIPTILLEFETGIKVDSKLVIKTLLFHSLNFKISYLFGSSNTPCMSNTTC